MNLTTVLVTGSLVFLLGIYAVLTRKNLISMLMGIELMLNGAAVNFAGFAQFNNDDGGRIMLIFIMTIAALEATVILGLIFAMYQKMKTLSVDALSGMKK